MLLCSLSRGNSRGKGMLCGVKAKVPCKEMHILHFGLYSLTCSTVLNGSDTRKRKNDNSVNLLLFSLCINNIIVRRLMQTLHLLMKQRVNETFQHFGYVKIFKGYILNKDQITQSVAM